MTIECILPQLEFQAFGNRKAVGDFKGAACRCCAKPTGRRV